MSKENKQIRLTDNEYRLMEVIWDTEPVLATKLVEICLEKCGWKKSTVYTMLRRMDTKGILSFADGEVVSGIKREQALKAEGEALLQKAFGDSLPDFFAAFLEGRHLTKEESDRIQKMIRDATE
ncbi:MAG: BlaI/MecI/CopY family transcriptional regulator [Lachnospiraceae bacterium]|jgi:predicted transcriptional regulator|nr:BlaI/MecI/CopY family transcriptional regulator [Lachnospiraceae bacterium]MBR6157375.1 BlaI/MecI/CopY family transcriptional regulator [Lachnospiraceae bacterium]MBR6850588.1 BlaI/MecI/CopY family transcriptional regulator [Lachnospiraceae bacterium]